MFYSEEADDGSMSESWIGFSMCVCVFSCTCVLSSWVSTQKSLNIIKNIFCEKLNIFWPGLFNTLLWTVMGQNQFGVLKKSPFYDPLHTLNPIGHRLLKYS